MGTILIPGAERLTPSLAGGTITSTAPPRVVWHTVEAPAGKDSTFQSMINVLTGKSAEPNVLYDPKTDRLGQFFGLNLSGRALKNDGATQTNRTGRVCIQIEVMGYSAHPFTADWTPGPNFRALMAAIRSWGIPDQWPSGPPPRYVDGQGNVPPDERSRTIWLSKAGHYGHSQIPGNDHGDPGGIDVAKLFAAAPTSTPTPPVTGGLTMADAASIEAQLTALDNKLLGRYRRDEETRALTLNAIAALAALVKTDDAAEAAALAKAVTDLKAAIAAPKA
jgi:hypothetical protein